MDTVPEWLWPLGLRHNVQRLLCAYFPFSFPKYLVITDSLWLKRVPRFHHLLTRRLQFLYVFRSSLTHSRHYFFHSLKSKLDTHLGLSNLQLLLSSCLHTAFRHQGHQLYLFTDNRAHWSTKTSTATMFALVTEILGNPRRASSFIEHFPFCLNIMRVYGNGLRFISIYKYISGNICLIMHFT